MKRFFIMVIAMLMASLLLSGCSPKQFPPDCYKTDVAAVYFCAEGYRVIQYASKNLYVVQDIDGIKTECGPSSRDTHPCNILKDEDYCPPINYCQTEEA